MKIANVKHLKFLKALRAKTAGVHQAVTAAQILPVLDDMILNLEDEGGEDARTQAYGELLAGARAGDRAMSAEVSTIRSIRVDNFLRAKNNALAFLDLVVLGPAEVPYITNTSRMEIDVAYSGQDGRVRKTQGVKYQEDAQCSLFLLSSAEFEYPLKDMLRGSVADETKTPDPLTPRRRSPFPPSPVRRTRKQIPSSQPQPAISMLRPSTARSRARSATSMRTVISAFQRTHADRIAMSSMLWLPQQLPGAWLSRIFAKPRQWHSGKGDCLSEH
jgi:hypothetical protein